jgi:hypothetical protein
MTERLLLDSSSVPLAHRQMSAEEVRLNLELKNSCRASHAAWYALTYPTHSMIHNSEAHRRLAAVEAAARGERDRARAAVRDYHRVGKSA